jgi:hypothetical protein
MLPIKYSTINKLKKEGQITDNHLIGKMLTSESAKELYKNNIRVHPKFYIPKDRKKYFHEEEIKGGKINLIKSFKKFGSTVKHSLDKAMGKVQTFGEKAIDKIQDYGHTIIHGRNDYPPSVRELIKKYGDEPIASIIIDRTPVPDLLTGVLNAVSLGRFKERLEQMPYDKIFHLRIDITFINGKKIAVEKNEVINMYENPKKLPKSEQKQISIIPPDLTLNKMLTEAQKIQGNKYFKYSAYDNNCQDFIMALLRGSNVGTQEDYNFVKQDAKSMFKDDSFLRKFSNTLTDIGAKVNEITTGSGISESDSEIQSVVFSKDNWTKAKAIKWLKKHDFEGLECDEKENTLRFRQKEPNKKYKYITKSLPNEIELIITYKNKLINNKYNKMGKYETDSETSSSDSEMEMSGRGIKRERAIIKKMKSLRDEIGEHQEVHGGKLNIGKAFKKLGSTIKKGFNKEIANPTEKLAKKAGKYITAKKGGLATDLIDYGVPAATSAILGGLTGLATGGNPVAGVAAGAAGSKLGKEVIAKELHKLTGAGMKKRGRPSKKMLGDLVHIDIASHNPLGDIEGTGRKRRGARNASLEQMVKAHREKEKDELMEAMKLMASDINKEKHPKAPPKYSKPVGSGFKKGSQEAKDHMAKIRAMKGKK